MESKSEFVHFADAIYLGFAFGRLAHRTFIDGGYFDSAKDPLRNSSALQILRSPHKCYRSAVSPVHQISQEAQEALSKDTVSEGFL